MTIFTRLARTSKENKFQAGLANEDSKGKIKQEVNKDAQLEFAVLSHRKLPPMPFGALRRSQSLNSSVDNRVRTSQKLTEAVERLSGNKLPTL